jgi:hypothetical protein
LTDAKEVIVVQLQFLDLMIRTENEALSRSSRNSRRNSRDNTRTGRKNPGAAGDPAAAIGRDSAARDNAVEMRMMMEQILTPSVEHSEETNLRAQMLGVGSNRA